MNIHISKEILQCQKCGAKHSRKAQYENHVKKCTKDQNQDFTSNEPSVELDH